MLASSSCRLEIWMWLIFHLLLLISASIKWPFSLWWSARHPSHGSRTCHNIRYCCHPLIRLSLRMAWLTFSCYRYPNRSPSHCFCITSIFAQEILRLLFTSVYLFLHRWCLEHTPFFSFFSTGIFLFSWLGTNPDGHYISRSCLNWIKGRCLQLKKFDIRTVWPHSRKQISKNQIWFTATSFPNYLDCTKYF